MKLLNRRSFLLLMGNVALTSTYSYARCLESKQVQLTRIQLKGPQSLFRSVRIAHLTDFHYATDTCLSLVEQSVELVAEAKPDIIFLTGDFITDKIPSYEKYLKVLRTFQNLAPTYASLGNHDGGTWAGRGPGYADTVLMKTLLKDANIRCLYNEEILCTLHNQPISIVGLADAWSGDMNPAEAFKDSQQNNAMRILLSHNPDTKDDVASYSWDLMLSGHTHGGQVVIPIINYVPFVPVKDRRFIAGLKYWNKRYIHISRGVGSIAGMRLNCPPEVSILDIIA